MYAQMKRGFLKKGLDTDNKVPAPKPEATTKAQTQVSNSSAKDEGMYGQMRRGSLNQSPSEPSARKDNTPLITTEGVVPPSRKDNAPMSLTEEVLPPAKPNRNEARFEIVCPADEAKSNLEQPGIITVRLSPSYCTYSADGEEPSMVMIAGYRLELEEFLPFAKAALQKPLPPQGPRPFRISDAGKKGLGMFATRAIKAGELIIAERPLVISSPHAHGTKYQIAYVRSFYDAALAALSEPARAALLDLADSCSLGPPQCAHPLAGRIMTNGYSCGPLTATNAVPDAADLARGAQAEGAPWHATYATLPRANHACAPNAHYSWNRARWCGQFYAARDIAAGEEITSKYVVGLTRAERRAQMERVYSCACLCALCLDDSPSGGPSSDRRRLAVDRFLRTLRAAVDPRDCPRLTQDQIRTTLRTAREEGLMMHYAGILWEVSRIMRVQENEVVGMQWAKEARKAHVLLLGEESWLVAQIDDSGQFLAEQLRRRGVACEWP